MAVFFFSLAVNFDGGPFGAAAGDVNRTICLIFAR
jgi:hypothetical protein